MFIEAVFISTMKGKIEDVSLVEIVKEAEEQKEIHVYDTSSISTHLPETKGELIHRILVVFISKSQEIDDVSLVKIVKEVGCVIACCYVKTYAAGL